MAVRESERERERDGWLGEGDRKQERRREGDMNDRDREG